jgi:hypothetical protein
MSKYKNKRMMFRGPGGKFRKACASDLGIAGVCDTCNGIKVRHYGGDPKEQFVDPFKFRNRCFNCEPETPEEMALREETEAARPKQKKLMDILIEKLEKDNGQD